MDDEQLFTLAMAIEDETDRAAFLTRECGEQSDQRLRLEQRIAVFTQSACNSLQISQS